MSSLAITKLAAPSIDAPRSTIEAALDVARTTTPRFGDALERIYSNRYTSTVPAPDRFFIEHPGVSVAFHGAVAAVALGTAAYIPFHLPPTVENVLAFAAMLVGGIAFSMRAAFVSDTTACRNAHRTAPIAYDEVKGFVDDLRRMTPEQRATIAPEIARWGEQRLAQNGVLPAAFAQLRDTSQSEAASSSAYTTAGRASAIANDVLENGSGWEKKVSDFLAGCPADERAAVAAYLRERLFDGERARVTGLGGPDIQKLYDMLAKV